MSGNTLYSLDFTTGLPAWSSNQYGIGGFMPTNALSVAPNGTVYLLSEGLFASSAKLFALSGVDGTVLWQNNTVASIFQANVPVLNGNGLLYVADMQNQTVWAFNTADGSTAWSRKNTDNIGEIILSADGGLFLPANSGIQVVR